jgi:hypothetical protein
MDTRQRRMLEALMRTQAAAELPDLGPQPPLFNRMRTQLDKSITRIWDHQHTQRAAASSLTGEASLDQLRNRIRRERMMPLVKVAKPLLKFAPGTAAALRVPHARASSTDVATAAIRLFEALKRHHKLLASAGYPKDFLLEMRNEADIIAQAVKRSEDARRKRAHATASLAAELKKGMHAVTVMEGILAAKLASDPVFRVKWQAARRVTARIGRPRTRRGDPVARQPQLQVI